MECEHPSHNRGLTTGIVVAGVNNSLPWYRFPQAILTCFPFSRERGSRAHKARVVQGLHNWDALLFTGIVGSRRNQGKRIVKMNQVGIFAAQDLPQVVRTVPGPQCSHPYPQAIEDVVFRDFAVMPNVFHNLVPCRPEQFAFA